MSDDPITPAEISRSLLRIEAGMERMKDEFHAVLAEMVRRDTWEAKNAALDREMRDVKDEHHKDIARLDDRIKTLVADSKRPPSWPSIVTAVVSLGVAIIALIK